MCGGSVFKAAKADGNRTEKYEETGLIVSACRHGLPMKAMNTLFGETFTHTHLMHKICYEKKCKFFCYDVICRYWKFAKKVGRKFPQFRGFTRKMRGFLPRMHAKAHHFSCQVTN
jgi:hypothetical protein